MSAASHNRAVQLCAETIAKAAIRAAAKPCGSPAQRQEIVGLLLFIAEQIAALKIEGAAQEEPTHER
jgi:hypothetical protein